MLQNMYDKSEALNKIVQVSQTIHTMNSLTFNEINVPFSENNSSYW